jgi:hypothetical protein
MIRLSPLISAGLAGLRPPLSQAEANATAPKKTEPSKSRRIEMVVQYRCPECSELHDTEDDAASCCEDDEGGEVAKSACECPVCGRKYAALEDAADCCLWHDIDAPTRWRIAALVEAGLPWSDAIRLQVEGAA